MAGGRSSAPVSHLALLRAAQLGAQVADLLYVLFQVLAVVGRDVALRGSRGQIGLDLLAIGVQRRQRALLDDALADVEAQVLRGLVHLRADLRREYRRILRVGGHVAVAGRRRGVAVADRRSGVAVA